MRKVIPLKNIKFLLLSIFVILITAGCSKNSSSDLVGTWYNELVYDYMDADGWYYCEQLVFGDESTYYGDYDDVGRYAFSDNQIYYLSGWNEGWELTVDSLSKDKLRLVNTDGDFHSNGKDVVTFTRLPEIKDFQEFIQGQWITDEENPYFDDIFEIRNNTLYVWGNEEYSVQFINENTLFVYDEFLIFIQKVNNNKIIVYPTECINESSAVEFTRID